MHPTVLRVAVLVFLLPGVVAAQPVTSAPTDPSSSAPVPPSAPVAPSVTTAKVTGVLGGHVFSGDKDVGRIIEVLVDADGKPRAAVVDFGGFLGIGSRKVAVDWGDMHFPVQGDDAGKITVDLTADNMRTAPEWKSPDKPAAIVSSQPPPDPSPSPAPAVVATPDAPRGSGVTAVLSPVPAVVPGVAPPDSPPGAEGKP
jgi:hypothetical protein